jgi:hypothetical protein
VIRKLCPFCLTEVAAFAREEDPPEEGVQTHVTEVSLRCPQCKEVVPNEYDEDYFKYPPLIFCLMGYPAHGKTVYFEALLSKLDRLGGDFPGFFWSVPGGDPDAIRRRLFAIKRGQLPKPSPLFEKPTVIRLGYEPRRDQSGPTRAPNLARCHLITYDGGGEAFDSQKQITRHRGYMSRCNVIVWLVSLSDLESWPSLADPSAARPPRGDGEADAAPAEVPRSPDALLDRYRSAMLRLGSQTRDQRLIVVLTKADLLVHRDDLPAEVLAFLEGEGAMDDEPGEPVRRLSRILEDWLIKIGYHNFVGLASDLFREVDYCIVSALGVTPTGREIARTPVPRGVLHPLYWLQSSEGDPHFSLADAIRNAPEGAEIELTDGVHHLAGPIDIGRALTIRARDPLGRPPQIVGEGPRDLIRYHGKGKLVIAGVAIQRTGPEPGHVLCAGAGEVELSRCRFAGARESADGRRGGFGLFLFGDTTGVVSDCEFADNARGGVCVKDKANPILRGNRCSGGLWGIYYCGWASGRAEFNLCEGHTRSGINVDDRSAPWIGFNTCRNNGRYGIDIHRFARPILGPNACPGNQVRGIRIEMLFGSTEVVLSPWYAFLFRLRGWLTRFDPRYADAWHARGWFRDSPR